MNNAIQKKLELLLSWEDKGFQRGYKRAQKGMAAVRKTIMSVVKAAAMIAGAFVGATAALLKFIEKGAQAKSVEESFLGFARTAGMAKDTIVDLREAVRDTIDDTTLMQTSVMALSGGLDPRRLIQYWEMAKQVADVSSRDTVEVFTALTLAINKAQPRTLEQIGITIRLGEASKAYTEATGKLAKEFTSLDRTMAISMALQKKYEKDFLAVGDVTTRVREKFQQLMTVVENLKSRFFELIAGSPAAQEFLGILTDRVQGFMDALDEEKLNRFVSSFVGLFDRVDSAFDRIEGYKAKLDSLWERWKPQVLGAAAGIAVGEFGKIVMPIATALGASGPWTAAIIAALAIITAGVVSANLELNKMNEGANVTREKYERMLSVLKEKYHQGTLTLQEFTAEWDNLGIKIDDTADKAETLRQIFQMKLDLGIFDLQEFTAAWDKFGVKVGEVKALAAAPEEKRTPGGLTPRSIKWEEDVAAQRGGVGPDRFEMEADRHSAMNARKLEDTQAHTAALIDLDEYRARRSMEIGSYEQMKSLQNNRALQESVRRSYWAMGEYQALFFKHGAHMGRTFNAMAMAGFTELIASYIEMKTKQAALDALWFAAHAIGALASGNFVAAADYAWAAVQMGKIGITGIAVAAGVRHYGQSRAEAMTRESQDYEDSAFSGEDDATGTRRTASGVVNGRPVIINIMSKVEIKSGVTVFGDSEDGLEEFYGEHIRDYIQDDIEAGIISIPA